MAQSNASVPPLPFKATAFQTFRDIRAFGDAIATCVGGLQAVESTVASTAVRSSISSVKVGDVGLMACATTPGWAIIGMNDQLVFGFARSGEVSYVTGSQTFRDVPNNLFLVADSCPRTVVTSRETSMVVVVVDRQRLLRTALAMQGCDSGVRQGHGHADGLLPRKGRLMPLENPLVASSRVLSGVFHAIDAVQGDSSALAALAIDDHVHRLLVMMLAPQRLVGGPGHGAGSPRSAKAAVDTACEFIEAHLTSPITLTRLEELTGLGARALQIAFQSRCQCSPTEWILRRRLECVRRVLEKGEADTSIRDVARRYGFLQAGHFARMYRRQFGELPSETVARRRC